MKRQTLNQAWKPGDLFAIPLIDGESLLGQVLSIETSVLNSVSCALFHQKISPDTVIPAPDMSQLFSTILTTRDLLDNGHWKVVGEEHVVVPRTQFPFESLRATGFLGAKVIGSRNVQEFANAFCALTAWDDWADPLYLDRLLITPDVKPAILRFKSHGSSSRNDGDAGA